MTRQVATTPERPRKRRRLRSQSSMENPPQPGWPPSQVPVEIFDEITSYLSRSDVKSLRLVNHEFDRMVSAKYFRNVVVPFRSEMYKARQKMSGGDEEGQVEQVEQVEPTDTLFSSGMRIFQSFGEHVLRFALSLELDEESLAYPPIKPTQKAVTSYWGIYRWPHESYLRYTELEGLEQTADETASMKEALKCLIKVQELGLCCDAGLGYLLGPDQQVESPPVPHPVFGLRNLRYSSLQRRLARADSASMSERKTAFENPRDFKYSVLQSMVRNAGYTEEQAKDAIDLLLHTENVSLMNIDFDERAAAVMVPPEPGANPNPHPNRHLFVNQNANVQINVDAVAAAAEEGDVEALQRAAVAVLNESTSGHPLQPRNLTRAQKEMLLELEWAHRALIQSYMIALIDNARMNSFSSLTTLTIAKIPSSHIFMFQRADFWQSLPNLTNVALAVVADWRQVAKVAPGCVEDTYISPVDAVAKAHRLLRDHIAKQPNITFLHFEWICGGEFAPGITQRNQYVLPAPFCTPQQMIQLDTANSPTALLSLPHIKHLSLKNCYSTPHVFLQVLRNMACHSLEKLELETVSLTGAPTRFHVPMAALLQAQAQAQQQPQHAAQHHHQVAQQLQQAAQQHHHAAQQHQAAPQPPPLPPAPLQPQANATAPGAAGQLALGLGLAPAGLVAQGPPHIQQAVNAAAQIAQPAPPPLNWSGMRLREPKLLTWAGIIECLAPAPTVRELLTQPDDDEDDHDYWAEKVQNDEGYSRIPGADALVKEKRHFRLEQLSFKSCGYVTLDVGLIDNHNILPIHSPWQEPQEISTRRRELAPFMQHCNDKLVAKVSNYLTSQEHFNLTTAFGLDTEWTTVYDEEVIEAAKRDGIISPGKGRFSGTINKAAA